ncbi:MAG: RelA/SpoT family protein [Fimbriimonas sp.]
MADPYEIEHDWEEPDALHALLQKIRDQRSDANLRKIRYAYFIAEQAHSGQMRKSGEPYIHHPLAVAEILVDLRMDDDSLCAALLHDVLEDCPDVKPETIKGIFGDDVLTLVDSVTKLKLRPQESQTARQRAKAETARQAETLRKMLLAMARDFRVMVIKLADRLHNMRTLDSMAPEKRTRIASETLDIYAPLAARLGIWQIKWQLEDLAFRHLHPEEFQRVTDLVSKSRDIRETEIEAAIIALKERFDEEGIKYADIRGRPKHLFSIFNKMVQQKVKFEEIYDLLALRILVHTKTDCYVALGIVHEIWVPMMALFFDYIAQPKANGYRSIHTKVVGPSGHPLEIQIRTVEMHQVAEFGVAAHWTYKEGKAGLSETMKLKTLREQLFDWSSDARTSSDFLRSVSTDLFSEQTFVFTPKGDVIDLPKDSTAVDFAFRVHTQLGMTLVGARVNSSIVPLSRILKNGDVVQLLTRSNAQPSLDWLQFVKSAHTRSKLKAHFRKQTREIDAQRGREALDKELKFLGLDPRGYLGDDKLQAVAEKMDGVDGAQDVLARVGSGLISVQHMVQRLRGLTAKPNTPPPPQVTKTQEGRLTLSSSGLHGLVMGRAKCCNPIPGDEVVGYVTRGRGIMVHRKVCPNATHLVETEPERLMNIGWEVDGNVYGVPLRLLAQDRQGLLMDIFTTISDAKTNVAGAKTKTLANHTAEMSIAIEVRDTEHLSQIMARISNFSDVISIERKFGKSATK